MQDNTEIHTEKEALASEKVHAAKVIVIKSRRLYIVV